MSCIRSTPSPFCNASIGWGDNVLPTFWPSTASTEHQIAAPIVVSTLNFKNPMRIMPAGIEIKWRNTGSRRAKKMPPLS